MTLHQSVLSESPKFAPREIRIEKRPDGTLVLRSPIAFENPQWSILDFIPEWAEKAPQRVFLAQRGRDGEWQKITYAELWQRVQSVGQALIDLGARRGDRLAILSGNSIEHAIVMFAAMSVGVVSASISPNYSLMPAGWLACRISQRCCSLLSSSCRTVRSFRAHARFRNLRLRHGSRRIKRLVSSRCRHST